MQNNIEISVNDVANLMGFRKVESIHHVGGYYYSGVFATGDFKAIDDYNTGVVQVRIMQAVVKGFAQVVISTIDDGVWQAYSNPTLKSQDIDNIVKDIRDEYGLVLPTEKEFNSLLSKYGLYGTYTG